MNIIKRSSRKGDKEYYYFEYGRCAGSANKTSGCGKGPEAFAVQGPVQKAVLIK
jgi:hypothetical protein